MNRLLQFVLIWASAACCSPSIAGYIATEDIQSSENFFVGSCYYQSSVNSGSCNASFSNPVGYTPYTFNAQVFSSGDSAGLHVYAASSFSGNGGALIASAAEQLSDALTLSSPISTGFVSMTFSVDGISSGVGYASSVLKLNNGPSCTITDAGQCTVSAAVNFSQQLIISVAMTAEATFNPTSGSGSALSDYSNTGFISALEFTDQGGNPLAVNYVSESGLTYPMPQSVNAVPEPSSIALISLGLFGIAGLRRHKVIRPNVAQEERR